MWGPAAPWAHDGVRLIVETVENNRNLEVRIDLSATENPATDAADGT